MTKDQILAELQKYLPQITIQQLRLNLAVEGSLVICLTVEEIIKTVNFDRNNSERITGLLSGLLRLHFCKCKPRRIAA